MTDPVARPFFERHALWVALGAVVLAGGLVAVGAQVAPERFYDHFWWEDIWGPLTVDAHQCKTDLDCPGVVAPHGVPAKDGYTITSELTYGAVLAVMLYGIYVGLFRKHGIVADGWFVFALLPWILLGPVGRALEDADVFCKAGAPAGVRCDPGPFAYVFISPVIYIAIAVCVIAAMLVGLAIQKRRYEEPRKLTIAVGVVLAAGLAAFATLSFFDAGWFNALPPLWWIALACAGALALFHVRARRGHASMNLVVFVLGLPFAAGVLYLVGRWLAGDLWSTAPWGGSFYREAGLYVMVLALLVTGAVWAGSRALVEYGVEKKWGRLASRVPTSLDAKVGYAGVALLALALAMTGAIPALAGLANLPVPVLVVGILGFALVLTFVFLEVGRGVADRAGTLFAFALGINLAMVLAHVVDGTATWIALDDPFGFGIPQYSEKHPFSDLLLRYWGGFLYPFAKLVMVLIVVWVLDRESQKPQAWDERNMVGLVKMAIFVLGFGPGLRDTLRLAMGV